jgi:hypothetical protein
MNSEKSEDQVARRMRFYEAHPEVTVTFDREAMQWTASWPDDRNGIREICSGELRDLLDRLARIIGKEPS